MAAPSFCIAGADHAHDERVTAALQGDWVVKCSDRPGWRRGRVTRLRSTATSSGTLPTELGSLFALSLLSLEHSPRLSGTLPTELGAMRLQQLVADNCSRISGTMPSELGGLYRLTELSVTATPRLCTALACTASAPGSNSSFWPGRSVPACSVPLT